jgi:hypothetical protein
MMGLHEGATAAPKAPISVRLLAGDASSRSEDSRPVGPAWKSRGGQRKLHRGFRWPKWAPRHVRFKPAGWTALRGPEVEHGLRLAYPELARGILAREDELVQRLLDSDVSGF